MAARFPICALSSLGGAATLVANVTAADSARGSRRRWAWPFPEVAVRRPLRCQEAGARDGVHLQCSSLVTKKASDIRREYKFNERLGEGLFGSVFKAEHLQTGIFRAIKVLPKKTTSAQMFETEMQALSTLDHPNTVKVVEHFEDEEHFYLVQELCNGPDLFGYAFESSSEKERLSEKEVSIIMRQAIEAVGCCHSHGYIHRDIKPENFMIDGEDKILKMIDFGLVTSLEDVKNNTEFAGTMDYMAPEVMNDERYGKESDIWSLGVMCYTLLAGDHLLPELDRDKEVALKHSFAVKKRVETCRELKDRELSSAARDFLMQMLQYQPEKRITVSAALSHPFILNYCHDS